MRSERIERRSDQDRAYSSYPPALRRTYLPNRVIVRVRESEVAARVALLPLVENKRALGGRTTAYVCAGGVCKRPTSDPAVFAAQLATTKPLPSE